MKPSIPHFKKVRDCKEKLIEYFDWGIDDDGESNWEVRSKKIKLIYVLWVSYYEEIWEQMEKPRRNFIFEIDAQYRLKISKEAYPHFMSCVQRYPPIVGDTVVRNLKKNVPREIIYRLKELIINGIKTGLIAL